MEPVIHFWDGSDGTDFRRFPIYDVSSEIVDVGVFLRKTPLENNDFGREQMGKRGSRDRGVRSELY